MEGLSYCVDCVGTRERWVNIQSVCVCTLLHLWICVYIITGFCLECFFVGYKDYSMIMLFCCVFLQLWKKSGAWLSNKLPVINASEEELERAQQQRQVDITLPLHSYTLTFSLSPLFLLTSHPSHPHSIHLPSLRFFFHFLPLHHPSFSFFPSSLH